MFTYQAALTLRNQYRTLPETSHKQIGVRAAKDAIRFYDRNPVFAEERFAVAMEKLPYAQVFRRKVIPAMVVATVLSACGAHGPVRHVVSVDSMGAPQHVATYQGNVLRSWSTCHAYGTLPVVECN